MSNVIDGTEVYEDRDPAQPQNIHPIFMFVHMCVSLHWFMRDCIAIQDRPCVSSVTSNTTHMAEYIGWRAKFPLAIHTAPQLCYMF